MSVFMPPTIPTDPPVGGNEPPGAGPLPTPKAKATSVQMFEEEDIVNTGDKGKEAGRQHPVMKTFMPAPVKVSGIDLSFFQLSPPNVAIDIYSVMALFQQFAQEVRSLARETRTAEVQAQVMTLKSAAEQITNAAEDRYWSAMIQGGAQILGGLTSVGMGFAGGGMGLRGIKMGGGTEAGKRMELWSGMFSYSAQGAGGIVTGSGTLMSAGKDQNAAAHEAERAELEANSRVHEQGVQQANEWLQQMMDVIRDVREKLSTIDQARSETNRGIARNV